MSIIRGLDSLLADLDKRARPDARSRNRVVTKYASVGDTVQLSSEAVTSSGWTSFPSQWVGGSTTVIATVDVSTSAPAQGNDLFWDFGEWG